MSERKKRSVAEEEETGPSEVPDHPDPHILRSRAEQQAKSMGTIGPDLRPEQLIHELQVHQIELETQNEELLRAHEEIVRSRSRYFDLFDLAPIGYIVFDEKGVITETNFAAAALLGQMKNLIVGQPLSHWIAQESEADYFKMRKCLSEACDPQDCELQILKNDGSSFWARFQTTLMPDAESNSASFRVAISDITKLKNADKLAKLAAENETLLLELEHRVKNTLAQIVSLVHIETETTDKADAKGALRSLENRVGVLSRLYDMLYSNRDFKTIRLSDYLSQVAWTLMTGVAEAFGRIKLELELDEITVDAKRASSFGMIVNELMTNALKHSFPEGKGGVITLRLKAQGQTIVLEMTDDGVELPSDFALEQSTGLGHILIVNLAKQLGGKAFYERIPKKRIGVSCDANRLSES
ncbi:MAG: histidine kinase dimerization/phosphoacceptor domain -containing protein [Rectinemataceae bacterium]